MLNIHAKTRFLNFFMLFCLADASNLILSLRVMNQKYFLQIAVVKVSHSHQQKLFVLFALFFYSVKCNLACSIAPMVATKAPFFKPLGVFLPSSLVNGVLPSSKTR